ncbi:MAG: putative FAD-linked oxidoreductase [Rhodocyclaceae bacterium]|nr:putative FAD-linked oxidoreductase [Rhodocyclaceae bacterium]
MKPAALIEQLSGLIGATHVLSDAAEMAPYVTDWRGRYHGRAVCVVRPGSTQEVAAVVAACHAAGRPMVPQGGNTGLCGGATPDDRGDAVLISLARLRAIRALSTDEDCLIVEAGCTLAEVRAAASRAGRLFPLSLASEGSCSIGGNLATNAGGMQVLRYGNMRELALGLEVVLPDGRVWHGLRTLRKDNTGYDLKHWFIGAEGTLGIITAAALRLFPLPRARAVAWVGLAEPVHALRLLQRLRDEHGERANLFELISQSTLDLVLRHVPGTRAPLAGAHAWHVLLELTDTQAEAALVPALEGLLADGLAQGVLRDAAIAQSDAQAASWIALRENASEAQKREGVSLKHDISVPIGAVPIFLAEAERRLRALLPELRIVAFGHMGDGNLHYNLFLPAAGDRMHAQVDEATAGESVQRCVHDLVGELSGSISAEHGLGQLKRAEILRFKSPIEMDLMHRLKQALDPQGLMNPGKVL